MSRYGWVSIAAIAFFAACGDGAPVATDVDAYRADTGSAPVDAGPVDGAIGGDSGDLDSGAQPGGDAGDHDAGTAADGGDHDSGTASDAGDHDAGSMSDAGMTNNDAGMTSDGGMTGNDAGMIGNDAGAIGNDAGRADAGPAQCGDRRITAPEECDDGNVTAGDGCGPMCRIELSTTCGNDVVEPPSEQCDDGNRMPGDGCNARCLIEAPPMCGDGNLDLARGEECDDGNTAPGDGCSPACQIEASGQFCGDSVIDPGEVCDDGNTTGNDGCNPTCNLRGTTSLFLGSPGMQGSVDGVGTMARVMGGGVVLATDAQYLWIAQAGNPMMGIAPMLRRADIATGNVVTVATLMTGGGGIATNGVDTVWVAAGSVIQSVSTSPPYTVTTIHNAAATGAANFRDGMPGVATFDDVRGLTWFGGFLWIVDANAAVIRRMNPANGNVITVAGTPYMTMPAGQDGIGAMARFTSPRYIVGDNSGTLYISDTNGNTIRTLDASTFRVGTFAGVNGMAGYVDGIATAARINRPRGITADGSSIYFTEFNMHTVRQGTFATGQVSTLAGMPAMTGGYAEGTGSMASFQSPWGIAYHAPTNSLFVADGGNFVIRRIQ